MNYLNTCNGLYTIWVGKGNVSLTFLLLTQNICLLGDTLTVINFWGNIYFICMYTSI